MYNKLMGYLCRDGLESFGFGLLYLHLGTVPVLFVSFCLICHPYMAVILEQNVFILVCVLLCYVRYVYIYIIIYKVNTMNVKFPACIRYMVCLIRCIVLLFMQPDVCERHLCMCPCTACRLRMQSRKVELESHGQAAINTTCFILIGNHRHGVLARCTNDRGIIVCNAHCN